MKKELIIFDLDDTLIDTSTVFFECRQKFVNYIQENTDIVLEEKDLISIFDQLDDQNFELFGYNPRRYSYNMVQMYLGLVKEEFIGYDALAVQEIAEIGKMVELEIPELLPDALEILEELSQNYTLALVTRGDKELQQSKIDHYQLERFFKHISVVDKKSPELFKKILKQVGVKPDASWSIGDSPKWDIQTAQKNKIRTILFKYEHPNYNWAHEEREMKGLKTLATDKLKEIPKLIKQNS